MAFSAFAPESLALMGPRPPAGALGGLATLFSPALGVGYFIAIGALTYSGTIYCSELLLFGY